MKTLKNVEQSVHLMTIRERNFDPHAKADPYFILMPVPNITGNLHIGHGINLLLQDLICRQKLLEGKNVFFPPGADHAGIMGQYTAEKELMKNNLTRKDLGHKKFLNYMYEQSDMHIKNLISEMHTLGLKANWSHTWFTHDKARDKVVQDIFIQLHNKGLVYRDNNVVNWCPRCSSCIADMELKLSETTERRYYIDIKTEDAIRASLVFIQPELLLGTVGIGITKKHPLYSKLLGQKTRLPFIDKLVKIYEVPERKDSIFDYTLRLIVPSYNSDDFIFAKNHEFTIENIYTEEGTVFFNNYEYDIDEIRKLIVTNLKTPAINCRTEEFGQGRMYHSLCNTPILPLVKNQWYMKMHQMEPKARQLLQNNQIYFSNNFWKNEHLNVLNDIKNAALPEKEKWWEGACVGVAQGYSSNKDWVISRQNWWGQKVPAWHCKECGHIMISTDEIYACEICNSKNIIPDQDVLDVWFSCALWPISVNPFSKRTHFVDISVMGSDIFYFWVASSNMICLEIYESKAFKNAFVHGLLCDEKGKKMSKSLGNVISMKGILEEYGAETLRAFVFTLMKNNSGSQWLHAGQDSIITANKTAIKVFKLLNNIFAPTCSSCNSEKVADSQLINDLENKLQHLLENMDVGTAYEIMVSFIEKNHNFTKKQKLQLLKIIHPFHPFITNYFYKKQFHGTTCLSEITNNCIVRRKK